VPQVVGARSERGRPRADDRHLATDHVEDLRQLVEARLAQEPADARDAWVVRDLEVRRRQDVEVLEGGLQLLGVLDHRPELEHREADTMLAGPLLREQHGTR
jgi:hypothetical protein